MTSWRARRVEIDPLDAASRESLQRVAARTGALHQSADLVVTGFGTARTIDLDQGLGGDGTAATVADALAAIALDGDSGPGGSGVLAMAALPFDPAAACSLVVPSLVAAWHPDGGPAWVTSVVRASESPDPFDALSAVVAGDQSRAPSGSRNAVESSAERPSAAAYEAAVRACVDELRRGTLEKVVLGRARVGTCRHPIDPAVLAAALHAND
ncbi:MAG TPA: hypothetical protein VKT18_05225, partial [Acidimicrobiales bacterium]|nr:hypothetical protein [Acidimicrobiales bacterium]